MIPRDFPETLSCNELCPSQGRKKEVEFLPFENSPVFQEKSLQTGCRKCGVKSKTGDTFEVGKSATGSQSQGFLFFMFRS